MMNQSENTILLKNILRKIGFSDIEATIYITCLRLGSQPASILAKHTGLKRTTAYLMLGGLVQKGLVSEYTGANMKYFTAVDPEYLVLQLDRKSREFKNYQIELEEYLSDFRAVANPFCARPKIQYFAGIGGVIRVMEDTLTAKHAPLLSYAEIDRWLQQEDLKEYIFGYGKRRVFENKIPIREIILDTPVARKFIADYPKPEGISDFRWFSKDIYTLNNEINIYDNKVAICTLGPKEFMGIIIESEEIVTAQRGLFEMAWKAALKE